MNIIINGAEAIPEGRPGTVTITDAAGEQVDAESLAAKDGNAVGELAPGAYVLFEVRDTGCGMDEETQGAHLRSVLHDEIHGPRARVWPPCSASCAAIEDRFR